MRMRDAREREKRENTENTLHTYILVLECSHIVGAAERARARARDRERIPGLPLFPFASTKGFYFILFFQTERERQERPPLLKL